MIKTSEQIFKHFDYQSPLYTQKENKDIYNFQHKEWVDKDKLNKVLDDGILPRQSKDYISLSERDKGYLDAFIYIKQIINR